MQKNLLDVKMLARFIILILVSSYCATLVGQPIDSICVFFRQGNAVIDTKFSSNNMSIDDFGERLKDMMKSKDAGVLLQSVTVLGAVSPEGPKWVNVRLAHQRAEELARLLTTRFSIPDSIIGVAPVGVKWNVLADSVEADRSMPCRSEVVRILRRMAEDPEHYNGLYEIRKIDSDGAAYGRLVSRHFPPMRTAKAYLKFNIIPLPNISIDSLSLSIFENCVILPCVVPVDSAVGAMAGLATKPSKPYIPRWIPLVLKTNMLYDAAAVPNLGLEIAIGRNWSVEADWMYAWWSRNIKHRYWRVYGGEFGVRRWFGKQDRQVLTGHHVGIYGQMLTYDFEFGGKGRQGGRWTWGGGVAYGYSLPVGRRLNIDFTIGFGYAGGEYKKYHPDDGCYVWDSTHRLNWFGPTKAEVSLVWYIDGRPARKGGAR